MRENEEGVYQANEENVQDFETFSHKITTCCMYTAQNSVFAVITIIFFCYQFLLCLFFFNVKLSFVRVITCLAEPII